MPRLSFRVLAALPLALLAAGATAGDFTLEQTDQGISVQLDGQPFTQYLIRTGPKPVLWPVVGPTGVEMTRAYPMREGVAGEKQDHPHQRSFWFTHGSVNGVDFWSELEDHGSIVHREYRRLEGGPEALIATRNDWIGPDGRKHLEDERTLRFRAGDGWRSIDFDIVLKATAGAVSFGDTKEGAFGVRVPTVMDVDSNMGGHVMSSEGFTDNDAWGKQAAWVDYYGPVEGQTVGVAILNHPSSFRHPTHWHVRYYGLFAANPFGIRDFTGSGDANGSHLIESGDSIALRYRVIFHAGDYQTAGIAEAYASYAQEPR
jgi:hypothetical protein